MPLLAIEGLAKRRGSVLALAGISFAVRRGEVFGLLGPNGAGKTTAVDAIAGLIAPDAGRIAIDGIDIAADPRAARHRIGVVLQSTGLPARITPREALRLFARLHRAPDRSEDLLARYDLVGKADAAVESLSGGQRQRLSLALAFVGEPDLILLDEPGAGLDIAMRRTMDDHIRAMRAEGRAILLTTHDMRQAEALCDRVALLADGHIVADGTPPSLIAGARGPVRVTAHLSAASADGAGWPEMLGPVEMAGTTLRFSTVELGPALARLVAWLDTQQIGLIAIDAAPPSLEDVILGLMQTETASAR